MDCRRGGGPARFDPAQREAGQEDEAVRRGHGQEWRVRPDEVEQLA
jgi:hypothetical protein